METTTITRNWTCDPSNRELTVFFHDERFPGIYAGTRASYLLEDFPTANREPVGYLWSDGENIGTREYWDGCIEEYPENRDLIYPIVFATVTDDFGDQQEVYFEDTNSDLVY